MIQLVRIPLTRNAPVTLTSFDPAAAPVQFSYEGYCYHHLTVELGRDSRHRYLLAASSEGFDRLYFRAVQEVVADASRRLQAEEPMRTVRTLAELQQLQAGAK
jgi:hypothetical protein